MNTKEVWLDNPEEKDFPAALDYLELLFEPEVAQVFVKKLGSSKTIKKKAKDIFRASNLSILPKDNRHVKANLRKFKKGNPLSPILLVRYQAKLIIADGYHRLCASYYLSEDLEVPCRLV
jgi:hypothetical protein